MWTAKIFQVAKVAGRLTVTVEYANGSEIFQESYSADKPDLEWLKTQTRNRIANMTAAYSFGDSLTSGSVIGPTIPTPAAPTQAEIDQTAFQVDYSRWQSVKRGIDAGVIDPTLPQVVALKTKVQTAMKPAYLQFL